MCQKNKKALSRPPVRAEDEFQVLGKEHLHIRDQNTDLLILNIQKPIYGKLYAVKFFKRQSGARQAASHRSCPFKDCTIWPSALVNIFAV